MGDLPCFAWPAFFKLSHYLLLLRLMLVLVMTGAILYLQLRHLEAQGELQRNEN